MAKEEKAKVKMTVIVFETESDNDTLKENIRSISATLSKALSSAPSRIVYTPRLESTSKDVSPDIVINEDELIEEEEYKESFLDEPKKTKKKQSIRQYRTPKVLDLDLTSGEIPLADFLKSKNPDNDLKKYLAIAYWFKEYREIEEITADHIYTCYKFMGAGWEIPADTGQPFRNMKIEPYGWFKSGSVKGTYIINHIGENEVRKMGNA